MLLLQLILYCPLFTAMVKLAVRGSAVDGLVFYPKAVQDRAIGPPVRKWSEDASAS